MLPRNLNMERIKEDLRKKGKLLSIDDNDSCLAVSCFLRDLIYNFSMVIEEENNSDPFADPREEQLTDLHKLFRQELRKSPFRYTDYEMKYVYRHIMALSGFLLKVCIARAYAKVNAAKAKKH